MDVFRCFLAAGNIQIAAARRTRADEDRVKIFGQQLLQAVDAHAAVEGDADVEDVTDFFVDHIFRQPEARNLRADHAAGIGILIEDNDFVAERRKIARHRQRGGSRTDASHALAVLP